LPVLVGRISVGTVATWDGAGWEACSVRLNNKDPTNAIRIRLPITSEIRNEPGGDTVGTAVLYENSL
jgi:hypothetical protein